MGWTIGYGTFIFFRTRKFTGFSWAKLSRYSHPSPPDSQKNQVGYRSSPNPKSATERLSYETAAFPAAWDDSFARPGVVSGPAQARRSSSALRITRSVRSFDCCAILADSFFVFTG